MSLLFFYRPQFPHFSDQWVEPQPRPKRPKKRVYKIVRAQKKNQEVALEIDHTDYINELLLAATSRENAKRQEEDELMLLQILLDEVQ